LRLAICAGSALAQPVRTGAERDVVVVTSDVGGSCGGAVVVVGGRVVVVGSGALVVEGASVVVTKVVVVELVDVVGSTDLAELPRENIKPAMTSATRSKEAAAALSRFTAPVDSLFSASTRSAISLYRT
jgi:hypothetical protein